MRAGKIIATVLLMALPAIAGAQDKASARDITTARDIATAKEYVLTAYAGFRSGGSFTDTETQQELELDTSGAVSLALDLPYDASRQYQILFSHQRTDLLLDGALFGGGDTLAMQITYLHFGGTTFIDGAVGTGAYMAGGFGATLFNPAEGYSSELYPSLNLGIGYQWLLGNSLALRVEARGYATLVNSSSALFCSGGCVGYITADTITQGELMLGLSGRF